MSNQYLPVQAHEDEDIKVPIQGEAWKPYLRQLFISSGIWTAYLSVGLCLGLPTVYIAQVRREANSTEAVSVEMATWLSSAFGYAAIPGIFIISFVTARFGRKKAINLVSINMIIVATSYYFSTSPTHILISEVLHALPHACSVTTSIIALVEYTSPTNRGLMLTLKSATVFWGIWAANAIGTFTSWKYICILSYINAFYSLTSFFWPESPLWLAKQGRYDESRASHRWLRGYNVASEKELELLINTQMDVRKNKQPTNFKSSFNFLIKKEFYKPVFLASLMIIIHQVSGKYVITLYAIDIIKKITNNEGTAYTGMLILDGVSILCMYIGCILSRFVRRRTLLFLFGSLTVLSLFVFSLYLYLVALTVINEDKYVSLFLLISFSTAIGLGPIILATSLYGELIPSNYKEQSVVIVSLIFALIQSTVLKLSPFGFVAFGMHGMFLSYGIAVSFCLIVLYKYLPETKDKTLQEIEQYFKN